jgi:hypothetical protein
MCVDPTHHYIIRGDDERNFGAMREILDHVYGIDRIHVSSSR